MIINNEITTTLNVIVNDECPTVLGLERHPECSDKLCVGQEDCWTYALRKKIKQLDDEWS